jgi:hypothetical protein
MIPQFLRHGAAQFAIGALAAQFGASAQDPTAYCKDHPDETRCVEFLGAGAAFQSRSGNVGSQQTSNVKDAARDNGRYVVFLHTGGAGKDAGEQVAKALRAQGFIVRGTDEQADTVGGAGGTTSAIRTARARRTPPTSPTRRLEPATRR